MPTETIVRKVKRRAGFLEIVFNDNTGGITTAYILYRGNPVKGSEEISTCKERYRICRRGY